MNRFDMFKTLAGVSSSARVLLITHNDLDGTWPTVLAKAVFRSVTVIHCSNAVMSSAIKYHVTNPETSTLYDIVIACDISCTEEDAAIIDAYPNRVKFILLDHHPTAKHLNKYKWAVVSELAPEDDSRYKKFQLPSGYQLKASGTALLFNYIEFFSLDENSKADWETMTTYVHMVSAYDTWEWHDVFGPSYEICRQLNSLLYIYGIDRFERMFLERVLHPIGSLLSAEDYEWLETEQKKIDDHISRLKNAIQECTIEFGGTQYSAVFCYTGQYLAQVFEYMRDTYVGKDLYIINSGTSISVRATKPEINAGAIVTAFGGGGHPGAAGFKIPFEQQVAYLEKAFEGKIAIVDKTQRTSVFGS